MLLSSVFNWTKAAKSIAALAMCVVLAACQFQPLHGSTGANGVSGGLSSVGVSQVDSRVAQQVRNHLLFLMNGGFGGVDKTHEARLRVSWTNTLTSAVIGQPESTAGNVAVTVSYDLVKLSDGKAIATGTRKAVATYDRTGQVFANQRAERDAKNRAAKEAAEALRLAIASDLSRIGS